MKERWNAMAGRLELAPVNWELQFNSANDDWRYAPPGSQPIFNPMTGKMELGLPDFICLFNPMNGSYQMGRPGWQPYFNPATGEWRMLPG